MATDTVATFKDLESIIARILNLALSLGGLTAFIMLIVGGFKFLTSGGDPKQTQSAQSTITWAIAGLLIAIAAWFILGLISDFTGIDLSKFSITGN